MALKSAHIAQNPYLYPVGNTPAVCLTDTVPPELNAKVLLLGCGDIRNLLFTMHSGAGTENRTLDFTCCDIEAEILARNIVTLTLIAHDKQGAVDQRVWNVYYHVFIDPASMAFLQAHVKILLNYAQSLEMWNSSKYASLIRFCDEGTFTAVVKLWKLYATDSSSGQAYTDIQSILKDQWKAAQRHQHDRVGNGVVLDGLRAAAPMLYAAYADASTLYQAFWNTGTCLNDKKVTSKFTIANPMFGCFRKGLLLHYGQNPLSGFHLAQAYTQLTSTSPSAEKTARKAWPTGSKALHVAFEQFIVWCSAFRKRVGCLTIRFVSADAIAFCHTLQHRHTQDQVGSAHWYRNPWSFEPLTLSKVGQSKQGLVPTSFDIIDTSNLVDHLGSLNVLAAASPLLKRGSASALRTEMMLPREATVAESAKKLLCGDLPAVALLLGLTPIQYWTNASATWTMNETLLQGVPESGKMSNLMSRPIVLWKPADLSCVRYDAGELAQFLYGIYLDMFADESFAAKFSMLRLTSKDLIQQIYDLYTRGSLTALLRYIKNSNTVDWTRLTRSLVADLIMDDRNLNMGPHHFQSLCVQLDMFGIVQLDQIFDWWHPRTFVNDLQGPFKSWKDIPSVVCITLVVPRNAVDMFSDLSKGNGTPLCHMQVQSSLRSKESTYSDIQMGFGKVQASGSAFTNFYNVTVTPDIAGWKGKSPLIVSTMVSTCSLVEYGDTAARVVFALKSTTSSAAKFNSKLGIFLHLHLSRVGAKDVFVSRHRPNMAGYMSVGSIMYARTNQDGIATATITPSLTATHISSVQVRYDIISQDAKISLQSAAPVAIEQAVPAGLKLSIATHKQSLFLPLLLKTTAAKTRIARKQSWIEYTAPIADMQFLAVQPDVVFPVSMQQGNPPVLEHLAYFESDALPKVCAASASWLAMHTSSPATMSGSEYKEYENVRANESLVMPGRLGVKESLHSMYMHVLGLHGMAKSSWFCLTSTSGDICMILVDCIRMDLSHQTVFLDAALLPPLISGESASLVPLMVFLAGNLVRIAVNNDETTFWKHLLPAFAERCRQWKHRDACEYQVASRVPISTKAHDPFVCSCGFGHFPEKYLATTSSFKEVAKFAVRVAIPVIFASPISKEEMGTVAVRPPSARPQGFSPNGARAKDTEPKAIGCLKCGATSTKAGSSLLKCVKCKTAQYCSPDCQKKDWKKHKSACKHAQEKTVGDDAA